MMMNELEKENAVLEKYIENLQKKCDKWKACWESAEKGIGILAQNLKSLRELQGLEIGEWEESEKRIRKILDDIPPAPTKYPATELLSEWMDGHTAWYKRMMEHLSNE